MAKKELMAAVKAYYDSQGWHYSYEPEMDMIEMIIGLRDVSNCRVVTRVHDERFVTYCIFPLYVDEDKRATVSEYLHRANDGLDIGNFEMDHDDGEIRYKANIFCGDQIPKMEIIEFLVDVGMKMFSRYAQGILKIMYSEEEVSPKELINSIEHKGLFDSDRLSEEEVDAAIKSLLDGEDTEDILRRIRELSGQMPEDGEEKEESGGEE